MGKRERGPDGRVRRRVAVSAVSVPETRSVRSGGLVAVVEDLLGRAGVDDGSPVDENAIELSADERASLSTDPALRRAQLRCFRAARLGLVVEPTADEIEARLTAEREAERTRRWAEFVPPRYVDAALSAVVDRDPAVGAALSAWTGSENLILTGSLGTGKTFAALAVVRPAVEGGRTVVYWSTGRLLQELRPGAESTSALLGSLLAADVLVLDDLGVEKVSEWTSEQLTIVIDDRYQNLRPIVVTTNDLGSLVSSTRARGESRLIHGATVIGLDGKRFR